MISTKLFDLTNKVIAITGGYGYLGTAISKALAEHGAQTIVLGRSKDKFETAFADFKNSNLQFVEFDIMNLSSIENGFKNIEQQFGKIDVLINNAFAPSKNENIEQAWKENMEGTLLSTQNCIQAALPFFLKQQYGKIINVTSMYGMVAPNFEIYEGCEQYTNPPFYGAAKAGIIQLTKYYASLYGSKNILVNTVSPGPFPSEVVQQSKHFIKNLESKTVLKRIGQPNDLQGIFVFLSSDSSNFVTGQNLVVDGGWTIM